MSDPLRPRAGRVPHLLFGGVVALLGVLAAWWFYFLAHAVRAEDNLWRDALVMEAQVVRSELRVSGAPADAERLARTHPRLEIHGDWTSAMVDSEPWNVAPRPQVLLAHEEEMRRRRFMIHGEGSLLLLLVLGCVGMLYRLVLAEQRWRRDTDLFLGRVTHEMKTPLAGLKAMLQTLRDGKVPPERLAEVAEMGLRQAEREEHLIENLLTAHRLATRAAVLEPCDVDLAAILAEFAAHRRRTMGSASEDIDFEVPSPLPASANPGAVLTILENLADNAFKYGAKRLVVSAKLDGDGVILTAVDDGQGFEPGEAERLFRPFRRGEDPRSAGRHGTGLGLPISRALAEEMGGRLTAHGDGPGRGARFELRLRRARGVIVNATEPGSPAVSRP